MQPLDFFCKICHNITQAEIIGLLNHNFNGMIATQRQQIILDSLEEKEFLAIDSMARSLDVSEATVRRDYEMLDKLGLVTRVRGGIARVVVSRSNSSYNWPCSRFAC